MLILITKYDTNEQIRISVPNRNITIEQLLILTKTSGEIYKFLASNHTKRIVEHDQILATINSNQFILCKENETCLVQIDKEVTNDYQRYVASATISDLCKENQIDTLHQYLLYENEYVPSTETQLASFRTESPIQFSVINGNLPISVIVTSTGTEQSVKLHCSPSITAKRLCSISCQLLGLDNKGCELMTHDDHTQIDDDITLEDINSMESEIRFQLISAMLIPCSVTCSEQTITLIYDQTTLAVTIVKDTLEKLHISYNDIDEYELIAINDDRAEIDPDLSIDDIRQLFSSTSASMLFELKKKTE